MNHLDDDDDGKFNRLKKQYEHYNYYVFILNVKLQNIFVFMQEKIKFFLARTVYNKYTCLTL